MNKTLSELGAISRMVEHLGLHLDDIGIKDEQIDVIMEQLQYAIMRHAILAKTGMAPKRQPTFIEDENGNVIINKLAVPSSAPRARPKKNRTAE